MFVKILRDDYTPDLNLPGSSKWIQPLNQLPLSFILMAMIYSIYLSGYILEGDNANWKFGSLHNYLVTIKGEYFRFVTASFLHGPLIHLFLNLFGLFMVGPFTEHVFGKANFLILYLSTGIFATLASYFFTLSEIIPNVHSMEAVGASGSLFGLVGGLTLFFIMNKSKLDPAIRKRLLKNLYLVIGLNLGIGFLLNTFLGTRIDASAHLGGLISGFIIAFFLKPEIVGKQKLNIAQWFVVLMLVITLSAFIWNAWVYLAEYRFVNSFLPEF